MDNRTKMLIAIGASVAANCQPCLKTAITQAQKAGAEKKEILEAIGIARIVRKGAFGKMDKFASTLVGHGKDDTDALEGEGNCMATDEEVKEWVEEDDQCGCS